MSFGKPVNRSPAVPSPDGTDNGPWINLGNGRYRSQSTDRLRYVPDDDPEYLAYRKNLPPPFGMRKP